MKIKKLLLLLLFASPLYGQTTVLPEVQLGTAQGLGYNLPYTAVGAKFEETVFHRVEMQVEGTYSPTAKSVTTDKTDTTIDLSNTVIIWAANRFGIDATISESWLTTSQFQKSATYYKPGVVFRGRLFGAGTRYYLNYILPSGRYDPATGIEANRLQGPDFEFESRIWKNVRVFLNIGVYHLLTQGNPQCDGTLGPDTCPRGSLWSGESIFGIRFQFPGADYRKEW